MNIFSRIWTGFVAAVAGVAVAILVQVVGQMTMGFQIDYLKWIVLIFASVGFLLGIIIGPRSSKPSNKSE
jgi:hypothetical protein